MEKLLNDLKLETQTFSRQAFQQIKSSTTIVKKS